MHISNWSANRSGPAMTIHGTEDATGSKIKLSGVKQIQVRNVGGRDIVYARAADGDEHILRVG